MYRLKLAMVVGFVVYFSACSDNRDHAPALGDNAQPPVAPYVYTAAQQDFIDQSIVDSRAGTFGGLLHLVAGLSPLPGSFEEDLEQLNSREDTADFALPGLLTILANYRQSESLPEELAQQIESAVLNFKFWPDELEPVAGTTDQQNMVTWTENHYILFASGAYVAGQLYPDSVFPASGRTGREMMAVFKPRILRWLELRYASGFSEWLSNVYYDENIPALLTLINLATDEELVDKSRIVLDLLMADMALNNFQGNFGATHGRSYEGRTNGRRDSTRGAMHLAFGLHTQHTANPSATMLALSEKYTVPEVLKRIANDASATPTENRQRMGIKLEEAANWGLDINNIDDGMLFMTMEPYTDLLFIETFYAMLNAYEWWGLRDFQPFNEARALLGDQAVRTTLATDYAWDITRNYRPEVNIYTYRTAHYMLSTAQDWRKGFGGDQSSIWQATLGMEAVAFTTHPGSEDDGASPNYWVGSGTLPRAAQIKNVVISLYDVDTRDGLVLTDQPLYTHAFLPRAKFDETEKAGSWFFARNGDAYLALWSSDPEADWIPGVSSQLGGGGDYDIIAQGEKTIWLCELGDASVYGDFDSFKMAISGAELIADAQSLTISYNSPSQGSIEMGWDGDVLHNGVKAQLDGYGRYENPWSQSAFPASDISFIHGDSYLKLNFGATTRDMN